MTRSESWLFGFGTGLLVAGTLVLSAPRSGSEAPSTAPVRSEAPTTPGASASLTATGASDTPSSPSSVVPTRAVDESVSGIATWYRWHEGEAAAGPGLRAAIGRHWRGTVVRVCRARECVRVRLSDWMASAQSLIDLDVHDFAGLADPSRGTLSVTVRW